MVSLETEPSMTKQKQSLVDLAAKHGVDLYQDANASGKGAGKSRRTSKRPPKKPVGPPPSASDFQLEVGTFLNGDATPSDVISEISTRASGVALLAGSVAVAGPATCRCRRTGGDRAGRNSSAMTRYANPRLSFQHWQRALVTVCCLGARCINLVQNQLNSVCQSSRWL